MITNDDGGNDARIGSKSYPPKSLLQLAANSPVPGWESLKRMRDQLIRERQQHPIGTPQFNDLSRQIDEIEPKLFPLPQK